jgi:hypothetical protein
MGLTISNLERTVFGNKRASIADIAFDSSYAFGGESLTPGAVGLSQIERAIIEPKSGMTFEYDFTNQKVKAFCPAPPIVFEELVTVTAGVGTLKYPAAYIMYVGFNDLAFKVIPGSLTPVTGSVAVSTPAAGIRNTLTFLTADAVTSCYVTYVTQAWPDVFNNLVHAKLTGGVRVTGHSGLVFTAGTPDLIDLGEYAIAIQNITWSDNGVIKPMQALYLGETAATTEATIDFSVASNTRISVLQTDTMDAAADSVYIDYIRKPSSGFLANRFIEEDDCTPSGDVITLSSGLIMSHPLIFGTCGGLPGPTTKYANLINNGGDVGTTATLVKPSVFGTAAAAFAIGSNHADTDHLKPSYVCGYPWEIQGLVPLEVPSAHDLSGLTGVKVTLLGR